MKSCCASRSTVCDTAQIVQSLCSTVCDTAQIVQSLCEPGHFHSFKTVELTWSAAGMRSGTVGGHSRQVQQSAGTVGRCNSRRAQSAGTRSAQQFYSSTTVQLFPDIRVSLLQFQKCETVARPSPRSCPMARVCKGHSGTKVIPQILGRGALKSDAITLLDVAHRMS